MNFPSSSTWKAVSVWRYVSLEANLKCLSRTISKKINSSFVNLILMTISGRTGVTQRSGKLSPRLVESIRRFIHWADIFHCQNSHICILEYCHCVMYIAAGSLNLTTIQYMVVGLLSAPLESLNLILHFDCSLNTF